MRLMRASMRGSKRSVIVVDSRVSALRMDEFIRRTSRRASAQNAASCSSDSNFGISDQRVMTFIEGCLRLVAELGILALVEGNLLRRHVARENRAVLFPVCPEDGEDAAVIDRAAEIEIARVLAIARFFGEEANAEGILERLLDLLGSDLAQVKWGVQP